MMMKSARRLWRWSAAGCGLVTLGVLAITNVASPAVAADFGEETFTADVGGPKKGTRLNGRGHTFDEKPYRHPQSLRARPVQPEIYDRHAHRDEETVRGGSQYDHRYDHDAPNYGSLKDDGGVPYSQAPRDDYHDHDYDPDFGYSDRAERRWNDRGARRAHCIPKRHLRRKLRRAGWRGFRRGRVRGHIGYVVARQRGTGEIYELTVDRCTGDVISQSCIGRGDRGFRRRGVRFGDYREDVVIRW